MEPESKDPVLWKIAKKRAGFKYNLIAYIIINTLFWAVWYVNPGHDSDNGFFPWPMWPMFGWGIGIIFNYLGAYTTHNTLAEKEYQKLTYKQ